MRPTPWLAALSTAACLLALSACGSDDGDTEPPSVPSNVTVDSSSSTSAHVMWNRSADEGEVKRYEVFRNGAKFKDVPASRHMLDVTGLKASTTYTFAVRARDADGNVSRRSTTASVTTPSAAADDSEPPTAPAGLKGRANGPRSATLTWQRSKDDHEVTAYDVYQAGTKIHSVSGTKTSAAVTTLRPGTRYAFTVKARDAADNASPQSEGVTVTTEAQPGGDTGAEVPTDLQGTSRLEAGRYQLDLVWNAPKTDGEITEYEVYVDGKFGSKLVLGGTAPKDTGTLTLPMGKKAGVTYAVKVRAKLPDGNWGPFTEETEVKAEGGER
ncbi:fibronectin type III domain-containing protein [Streptomyces sp. NPDC054784]